MNDRATISSNQLAFLAAGSALMFPYTFMPILRTYPYNQDAWIVLLLAVVYILVLNTPMLFLANKFRGLDINDINVFVMGKVGGRITALIYMALAIFCFIACMMITVLFIKTYILAETPEWAILVLMLIPITYAMLKGAGTIARVASFVIPIVLFTVLFFFVLGIKDMEIDAIKPIFADSTLWDLNKGAFLTAARFSEILIIVVFSYHLMGKASINKSYLKGILIFGITFFIMLISILLLVGSDVAKLTNNPYYFYSRQVGGEDFLQRVQSLNILVWFSGTLIKLSVYGYIATYMFSRITGKKNQHFYAIPLSLIGFIACLLPFMRRMNTLHILKSDAVFPWIVFSIIFVLTTLLLVVYFSRRATINKKIKEKLEAIKLQQAKENQDNANEDKKQQTIIL